MRVLKNAEHIMGRAVHELCVCVSGSSRLQWLRGAQWLQVQRGPLSSRDRCVTLNQEGEHVKCCCSCVENKFVFFVAGREIEPPAGAAESPELRPRLCQ